MVVDLVALVYLVVLHSVVLVLWGAAHLAVVLYSLVHLAVVLFQLVILF